MNHALLREKLLMLEKHQPLLLLRACGSLSGGLVLLLGLHLLLHVLLQLLLVQGHRISHGELPGIRLRSQSHASGGGISGYIRA